AGLRRADSIVLPAGRHEVAVRAGRDASGALVWSGVALARTARDGELARLGTDGETLAALAARTAGAVVSPGNEGEGAGIRWPELPGGYVRAAPAPARPLIAPAVAACLAGLLLVLAWGARRLLRFD